jgi:hypothetical protein
MRKPRSAREEPESESEFVARLAANLDERTLSFVARLDEALAEAVLAVYALCGSQDFAARSDLFERVLHAGIQEAAQKLPWWPWPFDRSEFDALPILQDGEDSSGCVGVRRKQLRSWWILIDTTSNGKGGFFRPEMMDGEIPPN